MNSDRKILEIVFNGTGFMGSYSINASTQQLIVVKLLRLVVLLVFVFVLVLVLVQFRTHSYWIRSIPVIGDEANKWFSKSKLGLEFHS
jgi:hypothetical protein